VGGGVQVAASLIGELERLALDHEALSRFPWLTNVTVVASQVVLANKQVVADSPLTIDVVDRAPHAFDILKSWLRRGHEEYDVAFVVFGPMYHRIPASRLIQGCADVRSFHPRPAGMPSEGRHAAARTWARSLLSKKSFARSHALVVESESMRHAVVRTPATQQVPVWVVRNGYHQVFDRPEVWGNVELPPRRPQVVARLGYVTRAYPHKNLQLLPLVHRLLRDRYGIEVEFVVTLNADEWEAQSDEFRRACRNVGPLTVDQLPKFYEQIDLAFFPSLLEASSAMPIEALRMGVTLVASDREFVRETTSGAFFFEPTDPGDAARAVASAIGESRNGTSPVKAVASNARSRAMAYLDIIDRELRE
jgi:glycosyltransferase involved in cell wall biosynthesis